MRSARWASVVACVLTCWAGVAQAAGEYPLTLSANAQVTRGATTVTSTLRIHVDRLMDELSRTRVTDVLKYEGYQKFFAAFRGLPVIGAVQFDDRSVPLRYAREQPGGKERRLVLVANQPLFFFGGDPKKARAGYELTIVDLVLDDAGAGTGSISGAARVKPAPDGGIILDDFAEAPVRLTVRRVPEK